MNAQAPALPAKRFDAVVSGASAGAPGVVDSFMVYIGAGVVVFIIIAGILYSRAQYR